MLLLAHSRGNADTAYLQPETVYEGDISELVIEYDNPIPSLYALDTAALETDFEVLDLKSKISRLAEAGRIFHRMQWRLQILPRRSGRLVVPALYFSDRSTPSLSLEVLPAPAALQSSHDVFVEVEAIPPDPYIGQQVQVSTRLYHNTPLTRGNLKTPVAGDHPIHHHPSETDFPATSNGSQYRVIERNMALFARSGGELILAPASYRGQIFDATRGTADFRVRNIFRRSKTVRLQVRSPPPDFGGRFWLPARQFEITQSFGENITTLKAGDLLDWRINISARGLAAEWLPSNLLVLDSEQLKIYPDQPIRDNRFDGGDLIGSLQQRFAVIATGPGKVALPGLVLKWWDVASDSERQVELAARTIDVVGIGPAADRPALPGHGPAGRLLAMLNGSEGSWLPGILALLGLLLTVCIVTGPSRRWIAGIADPVLQRRRRWRKLKQACLSNDARQARHALIEWGRGRWPADSIYGLHQIDLKMKSAGFSAALANLDAALFSPKENDWRGNQLWQSLVRDARQAGSAITRDDLLPCLYPG